MIIAPPAAAQAIDPTAPPTAPSAANPRPAETEAPRPRIVLLPGLACDDELFAQQFPALVSRFGRETVQISDVHTRCASLSAMARELLSERSGPLVLVGCSMGGMVALEALRQAPARIAGLALLGSSARADSAAMVFLRREAIKRFEEGRMDEVLQANLPAAFHPRHAQDPALVDRYVSMIRRAGVAQLIAQNRAVMARADLRPTLASISCPTLVMVGEADLLTPPEEARELAAAIPSARLAVLREAGHMLTLEAPEPVTTLLLDWLAGLPGLHCGTRA